MLDTRPREMSEHEKEALHLAGAAAVEALEISAVAPSAEASMESVANDRSSEHSAKEDALAAGSREPAKPAQS